mmetsp:Transcript_3933/g.10799  ORF Transcript_3933/g.10799 Transcript_3933/m.10799 type:complete len:229 (-) Transcript_3933:116-802(-)
MPQLGGDMEFKEPRKASGEPPAICSCFSGEAVVERPLRRLRSKPSDLGFTAEATATSTSAARGALQPEVVVPCQAGAVAPCQAGAAAPPPCQFRPIASARRSNSASEVLADAVAGGEGARKLSLAGARGALGGMLRRSRSVSCRLRYSMTSWLDFSTSCASASFSFKSWASLCILASRSLHRSISSSFSSTAWLVSSKDFSKSITRLSCCCDCATCSFSFALSCLFPS